MSYEPATRAVPRAATPNASATQTVTSSTARSNAGPAHGTLRLRGEASEPQESQRRIRWAEDVVNNEGMGKKSSKVCCIYHKPREVGESSSEDSSDSSSGSDSDSDNDDGAARPSRRGHENEHDGCGHGHDHRKTRKPSPNAYERQPHSHAKTPSKS